MEVYLKILALFAGSGSTIEVKTAEEGLQKELKDLSTAARNEDLECFSVTFGDRYSLDDIHIHGYPTLKKIDLQKIQESPIRNGGTILIGPYGSGKSSVLMAIYKKTIQELENSRFESIIFIVVANDHAKNLKLYFDNGYDQEWISMNIKFIIGLFNTKEEKII